MTARTARNRALRAATSLVNVGVAGTAAIGAAALHSWAIVALGGAAYAALVAWDLASSEAKAERAEPRMPEPDALTDPGMRGAAASIRSARQELDRVLAETPDDVKTHLALTLACVEELEARAAKLVRRGEELGKYLATVDPRKVAREVEQLAHRAALTPDPEARAQYESARSIRRDHHRVLEDLANARERIAATLLGIAASLEALPPKVMRMRALDAQAVDALSGSLRGELDAMNVELASIEETFATLAEPGAEEMRS